MKRIFNFCDRGTKWRDLMKIKKLTYIMIALILLLLIGCGLPPGAWFLKFDVSNAKAVFAGSPTAVTTAIFPKTTNGVFLPKATTNNIILLKINEEGEIVPAMKGTGTSYFEINYILINPVTDDLFLLGPMVGYYLIRVTQDSSHFGLSVDEYHYYHGSGFDSTGAFYFTSHPDETAKLWRYVNNTATQIAESTSFIELNKVMYNGAVIYTTSGDTFLRKASGKLTNWAPGRSSELGVYSSISNTYYYGSKGFRFDIEEEFDSNVILSGYGDDFDAVDGTFITVSDTSIAKYEVQPNKTLIETILLNTHTIDKRRVDCYGNVYLMHRVGDSETFYFVGKDKLGNRNIFKLTGVDTVEKLLNDNEFYIPTISFDDLGNFSAAAQRMADGKYGTLDGSFDTGTYTFTVRAEFATVTDVLLY